MLLRPFTNRYSLTLGSFRGGPGMLDGLLFPMLLIPLQRRRSSAMPLHGRLNFFGSCAHK